MATLLFSLSSLGIFSVFSTMMSMLAVAAQPRQHDSRQDDESRSTAADARPEHLARARHGRAVGGADKTRPPMIVLDSGASFHATGDGACLAAFTAVGGGAAYRARDGRDLPVAGAGTLAREGFSVPGVRHVPALGAGITLVSVQQLAARGYLVAFGGGASFVKDPGSGSLLGRGRLHEDDGLYHLEFLRIPAGASVDDTRSCGTIA